MLRAPYAYPWYLRTTINGLGVWERKDNEGAIIADVRESKIKGGDDHWIIYCTWQIFHHHFATREAVAEATAVPEAMKMADAYLMKKGYKFIPQKFAALI